MSIIEQKATFYSYDESPDILNKELSNGSDYSVNYKNATEEVNPSIIVHFNAATHDSSLFPFNYVKIKGSPEATKDFRKRDKYYFIGDDLRSIGQDIFEIPLILDVLKTYEEEIKNLTVIANRASSLYNALIVDNEFPLENKMVKEVYRFEEGFNKIYTRNAILVTIGDGHNIFSGVIDDESV